MALLQLGGGDKAQDQIYDGERIGNIRGLRLKIRPLHDCAQNERNQCQHVDPHLDAVGACGEAAVVCNDEVIPSRWVTILRSRYQAVVIGCRCASVHKYKLIGTWFKTQLEGWIVSTGPELRNEAIRNGAVCQRKATSLEP